METGCIIDNSHFSAIDCNLDIINYARRQGWDGGSFDIDELNIQSINLSLGTVPPDFDGDLEDFEYDYHDAIYYAADQAVEWLNENVATDGYYYEIDDNSLYYWKIYWEN
jgi:hypothetical protein